MLQSDFMVNFVMEFGQNGHFPTQNCNSVVREGTSVQELALDITIAVRHNNTEFTCRVSFHGGLTASDVITIRSNSKNQL